MITYDVTERLRDNNPPIPTHYLRELLRLILKENSFQFNGKNYLQVHGTAMGTSHKKRYIDDIFSLWDINKPDSEQFIEQANSHHPTIKFTAEISVTETGYISGYSYIQRRKIQETVNP